MIGTQLTIDDWTARDMPWSTAKPKRQNRFTCKCLLCGKRWTARAGDRSETFARHGENCAKYQAVLAKWSKGCGGETSARWNLANSYMVQREIIGTFKAGVKCDARCQGAIGHDCECSCGGANHGIGLLA